MLSFHLAQVLAALPGGRAWNDTYGLVISLEFVCKAGLQVNRDEILVFPPFPSSSCFGEDTGRILLDRKSPRHKGHIAMPHFLVFYFFK